MESRLHNSIKNSISGSGSQIITYIFNFIVRTVFIRVLGTEYLGINGLFSNILMIFSVSEMGIGTAIVYNMYKAVADNNQKQINCLMSFYAKVYTILGIFLLIIGFLFTPFIKYLIKDNPFEISFLQTVFILMVINNSITYFLSYWGCIIFAKQKSYITNISSMIVSVVGSIFLIISLYTTKNYILYVFIQVLIALISNLVIFFISKKLYPEIVISFKSKLPNETFDDIVIRVKSLIIHSVSTSINFGTDNILISKFVGIIETGLYSNYYLILSTINGIIIQFLNGINASMGNLMVKSDKQQIYNVFTKIDFICHLMYGLITVTLLNSMDLFIDIWTGTGHRLNKITVIIILLNFYTLGCRQSIIITRNSGGLYTNDKFVAIIKPIINLFFSLILVLKMGIVGVFLGTLISQIVADLLLIPIVLFCFLFKDKIIEYYINYCKEILILFISCVLSFYLLKIINIYISNIILLLFISIFISIFTYIILFLIINRKSSEYFFFKGFLKEKIYKK